MSDIAPESTPAPATEAAPVEAPTAEATAPEPALPTSTETPAVEEAAPAPEASVEVDPFESYGGKDNVEAAYRLYQAAQTEDGVIQLFLEAGQSLGLGLKEIQSFFEQQGIVEPTEEPDPDEPLTRGEWQKMMEQQRQAAIEAQAEAMRQAAGAAVREEVAAIGLDPADPKTEIVLSLADKKLNGDFSPEHVKHTIRAAHAEYLAMIEKESQRYLQTKVQQAESVPSAPSGAAAPAEPPAAEPKDVAEAIKLARRRLGLTR